MSASLASRVLRGLGRFLLGCPRPPTPTVGVLRGRAVERAVRPPRGRTMAGNRRRAERFNRRFGSGVGGPPRGWHAAILGVAAWQRGQGDGDGARETLAACAALRERPTWIPLP